MRHRGPDSEDTREWPDATLVHTRLSIIDRSDAGAQPISNADGSIWAVFNGEIYNHRELRRELEDKGHMFRGRSDSEVLPHLYQEFGSDCVTKLRGMFAFALYDKRRSKVVLAKDRFGIKPLFFSTGPGVSRRWLVFASELRALLSVPGIDDRPNRQAIVDFAALLYIPSPDTFYTGIHALQPGEVLEAELGRANVSVRRYQYHRWAVAPDLSLTEATAVGKARSLLTAAVQGQLESDVPLGTLLSGGIDSSLVSVAAQQASGDRLRTFNVRFADKAYDETWAAVAVAERIDSDHAILDMAGGAGTWSHVTGLLAHAGQPFADTSLFAVNAVSQLMRQHVAVALSGDGGDEAFGGYDFFWQIARIARLQRIPPSGWRAGVVVASKLAQLGLISPRLPYRAQGLIRADDTAIIQSLLTWVREVEHRRLCRDTDVLPIRRFFEAQWDSVLPANDRVERLSAHMTEVSVRLLMANDYLVKVDTASMRESLEVRVPMLDEDLFSFGMTLPHSLKVRGRTCKHVLRAVASGQLPHAVATKKKQGFGIPVDTWVDAAFRPRLRDLLLGPYSHLPEFFCPEEYGNIVKAFCGDGPPMPGISRSGLFQRIIMLLSVQVTLDEAQVLRQGRLSAIHNSGNIT